MITAGKWDSTALPLPRRGFPCYLSGMTAYSPDATDWRILDVLQREGRASFAELARAVSMSPSAVTERVRRLEEAGVIQGYAAVVDPDRRGVSLARRGVSLVRLRSSVVGRPALTLRGQLEREALCAGIARAADVPAPEADPAAGSTG